MKDEEQDMAMLRKSVEELGEHFDTVQIFTTRHEAGEEDGTVNCNLGSGNWFARFGQVVNWLHKERENTRLDMEKDS